LTQSNKVADGKLIGGKDCLGGCDFCLAHRFDPWFVVARL
jgi:hypothetical protein